jgi:hypothetical protein
MTAFFRSQTSGAASGRLACAPCAGASGGWAVLALFGLLSLPASAQDGFAATGSNFGRVGLLEMPNARFRPDGTIETGIAIRRQRSFWTVNFQALPYLETTFRLTERLNATTGRGTSNDRAFDLKLRLWEEDEWRPALAIGLQDLIGTGIYQGEYIVASKRFWSVDATLGLGWGRLATGADLPNPLGRVSERFLVRPRGVGAGGTVALNSLFRGARAGIFAGLEYSIPPIATPWGEIEGLRAKVEYSSDALRDERGGFPGPRRNARGDATSRINAGLQWQPNRHLDLGVSFLHGTDLLVRASLRLHPDAPPDLPHRPPPPLLARPNPVAESIEPVPPPPATAGARLLTALAGGVEGGPRGEAPGGTPRNAAVAARLFPALRAAGFTPIAMDIQGAEARINVSGGPHRTLAQATARVVRAAQPHLPAEIERIRLLWERDGAITARLVTLRAGFEALARHRGSAEEVFALTTLLPAAPEHAAGEVRLAPPQFTWGIEPRLNLQVGDPQTSIRWQAGIAAGGRAALGWNLSLAAAVEQRIAGNLGGGLPSDSVLPRVRSDFARYARAGSTTLPALYAERLWNPAPDILARVTGGYLEPMFAGISAEVLWRPQDQPWALGVEVAHVAQRGYRQQFDMLGYSVTTGHVSLYADLPWWNLYGILRGGRYLAGDWGGTIEMGRRFDSGIEVGGFATFTNVRFRDFGEGSFDKGIFVRVPFDFLGLQTRSRAALNIRPVQRDGGQRLSVDNGLWEVSRDGRGAALREGYRGFGQ